VRGQRALSGSANRLTKANYADGTSGTYVYDQGDYGVGHSGE